MKNNTKIIAAIGTAVVVVAAIVVIAVKMAGGNSDVVGNGSVSSFEKVYQVIPDNVKADEKNKGWSLTAPDESVRFIWSEDYSRSPLYDVMLELDAEPFLNAGLQIDKLPDHYAAYDRLLMVGTKLGNDRLTYRDGSTPVSAYEQIVSRYRSTINYHMALDHYGIMLGDGNMFEWAKNLNTNTVNGQIQDKDIVFVLNPEPLIAAGVDPQKVEGWVYAQVSAEDHGKKMEVYKFLKPFELQ